jgi:hypothetical protein
MAERSALQFVQDRAFCAAHQAVVMGRLVTRRFFDSTMRDVSRYPAADPKHAVSRADAERIFTAILDHHGARLEPAPVDPREFRWRDFVGKPFKVALDTDNRPKLPASAWLDVDWENAIDIGATSMHGGRQ